MGLLSGFLGSVGSLHPLALPRVFPAGAFKASVQTGSHLPSNRASGSILVPSVPGSGDNPGGLSAAETYFSHLERETPCALCYTYCILLQSMVLDWEDHHFQSLQRVKKNTSVNKTAFSLNSRDILVLPELTVITALHGLLICVRNLTSVCTKTGTLS